MKPFRFRASVLLDLRRRDLDAAQAELTRARAIARERDEAFRLEEESLGDALARGAAAWQSNPDTGELERHRNWILLRQTAAGAARQARDEQQQVVQRALDVAIAAHQRVRVLERLRDRAHQRYDAALRREDAKVMDELAAIRHARRAVTAFTGR